MESFIEFFNISLVKDIIESLIIFLVFYLLSGPIAMIIVKLFHLKQTDVKKIKKYGFYKPLKLLIQTIGLYIALKITVYSEVWLTYIETAFRIITIILVSNGLSKTITTSSRFLNELNRKLNMPSGQGISNMIKKIVAWIIYAFATVIIINELGYDINGLIAGLGLGGLTIALAAKDAAANMFGGMVIFTDKPFKIGDWIKTGNIEGIVEEITFRSTRIRTFDNVLVIIPNTIITNETLINCSRMEKRRIKFDIQIVMNIKMDNLNNCINKIKDYISSLNGIIPESTLVFFDKIENSGYNIFVSCFTSGINYEDYLAMKQMVNYKIMEVLDSENVELAYPSNTIYLKNNS